MRRESKKEKKKLKVSLRYGKIKPWVGGGEFTSGKRLVKRGDYGK